MFATNGWKPVKKIVYAVTSCEEIDQRLRRHAGAGKHRSTAHDVC